MPSRREFWDEVCFKQVTSQDAWVSKAACRGADLDIFFFSPGQKPHQARSICGQCPVVRDCLEWAIENAEPHGIWGGASYVERAAIKRGESTVEDHLEMLSKCKPYRQKRSA